MKTFLTFLILSLPFTQVMAQLIDSVVVATERRDSYFHGFVPHSLRVDSFSNGQLRHSLTFDASWQLQFHTEYEYNINGDLVRERFQSIQPVIFQAYQISYLYDANFRITDTIRQSGNFLDTVSRRQLIYDTLGRPALFNEMNYNSGNWNTIRRVTYLYDINDSLSSTVAERNYQNVWMPHDIHHYSYNPGIFADTLYVFDTINGVHKPHSINVVYDSSGVDTCYLYQMYFPSTGWDTMSKETFVYNSSLLIQHGYYSGFSYLGDGFNYVYDSLNRLSTIHWLTNDICQDDASLHYNSDGNLFLRVHSHSCPSTFSYTSETYYHYSQGPFNILMPANLFICTADSVQIEAIALDSSLELSYQWHPAAGLSNDTIFNPYVFTDSSMTYTLIVSDSTGVSDTLELDVNVRYNPDVNIIITSLDTIYPCYSFTLGADTGNVAPEEFIWTYNGGAELDIMNNNGITDSRNGVFQLHTIFPNGCTSYDSIDMQLIPPDTIPLIQVNACRDSMYVNYPGGYLYKWHIGTISTSFTTRNPYPLSIITGYQEEEVMVIVRDTLNCYHYSEPRVISRKIYHATGEIVSCQQACDGDVRVFLDQQSGPHLLAFSDGDTVNCFGCTSYLHQGFCSGPDSVVITDADGCIDTIPFTVYTNSNSFSVNLSLVPDISNSCIGVIQINTLSSDTSSSVYYCINDSICGWFSGDTIFQNICRGIYDLVLYNQGCLYRDQITIDSIATDVDLQPGSYSFALFPNPANETVTVQAEFRQGLTITVTDATGRIIYQGLMETGNHKLSLKGQQPGLYFVLIIDRFGNFSGRKLILY